MNPPPHGCVRQIAGVISGPGVADLDVDDREGAPRQPGNGVWLVRNVHSPESANAVRE
jgi:hypothetical protein